MHSVTGWLRRPAEPRENDKRPPKEKVESEEKEMGQGERGGKLVKHRKNLRKPLAWLRTE
jgi:hypothetical protein